jgi:flagellin
MFRKKLKNTQGGIIMGMVVRTNYSALNATRHLNKNSAGLANSLEKLASGFKINKSADDASGLAISEKMKAQIKALDTASANCEDGISMIQTTEGYLAEVHDMLNRMVEISEKSANGTYETVEGGANAGTIGAAGTDRNALQAEMDQLCAEIDRIAATANFNNVKLFNGDLSTTSSSKITSLTGTEARFAADTSETGIAAALGAGADASYVEIAEGFGLAGTLKTAVDDSQLTISLVDAAGDTIASQTVAYAAEQTYVLSGDLEGITVKTGTEAPTGGTIGTITQHDVLQTTDMTGTFATNNTGVTGIAGLGSDVEGSVITLTISEEGKKATVNVGDKSYTGDVDDDGTFTLADNNGATIEITTGTLADNTATGNVKLGAEIDAGSARTVAQDKGDGLTLQIGETSNAADKLTVGVDRLHTDTLFSEITDYANSDGSKDVRLAVNESNTVKGTTGYTIDISGQQRASAAAEAIRGVINKVSTQRASLGAMQNRLDYTVNNLNTASENVTAANSRIRDTDMAKEMTKYTQMNVLSQAAQAMLAQANSQPQSVLQLLG